ncbi:hypothetical protein HMPREF1986_02401 [Oribacterium sp. oral taxon 078 str. F0263]|nr:hypothetical protein HMPREF1986_02401 [Oribacterium sp. oral taxon 078 str. F0263]
MSICTLPSVNERFPALKLLYPFFLNPQSRTERRGKISVLQLFLILHKREASLFFFLNYISFPEKRV